MARGRDIFLSEDEKDYLVDKIKSYFEEERDEDIGNIEALLLIDHLMKEFGPIISSKAIKRFKERIEISLEDAEVDVASNLNF